MAFFNERYKQFEVIDIEKPRAYPIMLNSFALQHYFNALQERSLTWDEVIETTRKKFAIAEHTLKLIHEWSEITLQTIMVRKRENITAECLKRFASQLQDVQSALHLAYRNENFLHNKLLNAIKNVDACKLSYSKSAESLSGLTSNIHITCSINDGK